MLSRLKHVAERYGVLVLMDILSVIVGFYLALLVRFAGLAPLTYFLGFRQYVLAIAAVYCLMNYIFGSYQRLWQYASAADIIHIIEPVGAATALLVAVDLLWRPLRPLPLSVVFAGGLFTMGLSAVIRYRRRVLSGLLRRGRQVPRYTGLQRTRTLIVGAGEAGRILGWRFRNQPEGASYDLIGYVDDDPRKQGMLIHGVPVFGGRNDIPVVCKMEGAELIVLAISNISVPDFNDIVSICETTSAQIKVVPSPYQRLQDPSPAPLLRPITLEDLIWRQAVSTDERACREFFARSAVMVTGAAGSVGSELCHQVLAFEPDSLIMLDHNETGLFELQTGLRGEVRSCTLRPVIADVTDRCRLDRIFQEYRPRIVFHAAAYKHVPLMEEHLEEAIRVNIGGTVSLAEAAVEHGCERFVFVSTDKAVEPVSVMGATKRVGEMLIASGPWNDRMLGTAVRFGNVLGSRGSVVPIFEYQIAQGGPITITHPDASRYFMSLGEAAKLIVEAAIMAPVGGVLLLDMGDPVRIVDLANRLVRLHGLRLGQDIAVEYLGLRPGEKLQERLISSSERTRSTSHPKILRVCGASDRDPTAFLSEVRELLRGVQQGAPGKMLREQLFALVQDSAAADDAVQDEMSAR